MEALNTQLLRFFDWLLWASLQGTVLIVLIVLIQKILRRRLPVYWHYFLWLLLLMRLAIPWLPESRISVFNLVPRSVQQGRIIESFSQSRSADTVGFYMHARSASAQEPENNSEAISVRFARMLPALWLVGTVIIAVYVFARSISLWRTVNSSSNENSPSISADGSTLFFMSDQLGGVGSYDRYDLWQVKILPVIDFNADGNINTDDLLILIGYWGQNEPLCDIGPTPLGDGIVDIKDLEVFMIYWEQENIPETPEEEL